MAELVWDELGDRIYETGISKGVLYKEDGSGVPWNGLTSVDESDNNAVEAVHFDGIKFNDILTIGDFSAVLRAFTYPEEFIRYEGTLEDQKGFYVTNQPPPGRFGLSYQTRVGDAIDGIDAGYKIHILYNLTAIPSTKTYETIDDELEPMQFEWTLTGVPEEIENFRPTAHVVIDSRRFDANLLRDVESIIYGDEDEDARLPSLKGLSAFIRRWNRLIITEFSDGTWTAESNEEGIISMLDSTTFQIVTDTAVYLDADTYEISSSDKNEEDV